MSLRSPVSTFLPLSPSPAPGRWSTGKRKLSVSCITPLGSPPASPLPAQDGPDPAEEPTGKVASPNFGAHQPRSGAWFSAAQFPRSCSLPSHGCCGLPTAWPHPLQAWNKELKPHAARKPRSAPRDPTHLTSTCLLLTPTPCAPVFHPHETINKSNINSPTWHPPPRPLSSPALFVFITLAPT